MSIHKDREYWRLRYWDEGSNEAKDDYFGKDKVSALTSAIAICDLKIRKWERRKEKYLDELEGLMDKAKVSERDR